MHLLHTQLPTVYRPPFFELPESVQRFIKYLIENAYPEKLILFGSRARGDFRSNSDFDVAVVRRGCTEVDWVKILSVLEEEPYSLQSIDLVEFEKLNSIYKKNILKEGKQLYGPS